MENREAKIKAQRNRFAAFLSNNFSPADTFFMITLISAVNIVNSIKDLENGRTNIITYTDHSAILSNIFIYGFSILMHYLLSPETFRINKA